MRARLDVAARGLDDSAALASDWNDTRLFVGETR
jgi:hypothetical protein